MKRISILCAAFTACALLSASGQDAATEERLNKLAGQIENLIEAQRVQQKNLEALAREIESLREQANKPTASYATSEDLKRIAENIKEVDRKRIEDAEKTSAQLSKLGQKLSTPVPPPKHSSSGSNQGSAVAEKPATEKGYPYTIRSGDTLSLIVQAYREKNIKITTDQILKANPGLKADRLKPGKEIWIPSPQS